MSIITINEEKKLELQKIVWKKNADDWYAEKVGEGFESSTGIKLGITQGDVSLLTGNFVLAKEADNLGMAIPPVVDTAGTVHQLSMQELTNLMLEYGQSRALMSTIYADIAAGSSPEPAPEPEPEPEEEDEVTPEEE
jgi:hypothetical protein